MDTVCVKNGDEVPSIMVDVTMLSLRSLLSENSIAFYELVMSCRDRQHVLFGNTSMVLIQHGLIESVDKDGRARIHDAVRSIVASAATGDGFDISLTEPTGSA